MHVGDIFICYFVLCVRIGAGLPNITGLFNGGDANFAYQLRGNGALAEYVQWMQYTYTIFNSPADRIYGCTFDASRSSTIYGTSGTVTPMSLSSIYIIRY